jgi:hypothetical protein
MSLRTLPPDARPDEIVDAMRDDGACIVRDVLSPGQLDRIDADVTPWIERSQTGADDFTGRLTKRTGALVARCPKVRPVVTHPLVVDAANALLGPFCERIQLHLTQTIAILPGQGAQILHRDRLAWGGYIPKPIEPQFNTIWALTDFTEENGATRIIPGSHLWDDEREPRDEETIGAVMPKGSFCVFLGGTYHGGGRNTTADQWRIAMFAGYALGWLRQEQNWYLSVTADEVREMPERLARLLGFNLHKPFLGWVQDFQDPYDIIHGYEELSSGGTDLYADGAERPVQGGNVKVA